jgi:uncharacterized protein
VTKTLQRRIASSILSAVLLLFLSSCQRAPLVTDEAGLFTPDQADQLALFHGLLLEDHDIDYRVLTISGTDETNVDINQLAAKRYADLEVGENSARSLGLLLIINETSQQVRMEVGYGLEGFFPDAFVAYIENRQMIPFFEAGRASDGILATTELIVDRAQKYALGISPSEEDWLAGSGGAGATSTLARRPEIQSPAKHARPVAGQTPNETLNAYFKAMEERNLDPKLPLYTNDTQDMLKDWVMTAAQADTVLRSYRSCRPEAPRFDHDSRRAVIRYPVAQRKCAPWFFLREGEDWRLDLTMMSLAVRFGRDNSWHFDASVRHPYEFAFEDWRFDSNGFPQE